MNREAVPVGVDDGYADIKLVFGHNGVEQRVAVPARIVRGLRVQNVAGDSVGAYETEGDRYTVSSRLPPEPTRVGEYHTSALHRVLVNHALIFAGFDGAEVNIACGLPVQSYYQAGGRNSDLIAKKVDSLSLQVKPLGTRKPPHLNSVSVYPQAIGAYLSSVLSAEGQRDSSLDNRRVAVLDIGGNTTDIAGVISGENPEIMSDFTRSMQLGVFDVRVAVRNSITAVHQAEIDDESLDRVLRTGVLDLYGETLDVAELVHQAVASVWAQMQGKIEESLANAATFHRVLLVGGGASLFERHVRAKYRHTMVPSDPAFANATGFYRYRRFVAGP